MGTAGPPPLAPRPGDDADAAAVTGGPEPAAVLSLLAIDFQGIYQVNVAAAAERLAMLRFTLSLLAAPFAAITALVSAKVVSSGSLTSWHTIPLFLFGLVAAFGLLAVLPYLRMIEASIAHARTARALNNFRLLYALQLHDEFAAVGWSPNLPVDPDFPDLLAPFSWPGLAAMALASIDVLYISVGLAGLARAQPSAVFFGALAGILAVLGFAAFFVQADVRRRHRRPSNPLDFPSVET